MALWIYLSNYQEDYIMERVVQFLKEAETYYLATVEGDQPRVRPFGTAHIFEGSKTVYARCLSIFTEYVLSR